jgi:hypothetical protein
MCAVDNRRPLWTVHPGHVQAFDEVSREVAVAVTLGLVAGDLLS